MPNRSIAVLGLACIALLAPILRCHFASLPASRPASTQHTAPPVPSDGLRVTLFAAAGAGPPVNLKQFGASTLVEAGGERFLFDCGRGTTVRLTQRESRSARSADYS